jgi:predicted TIM-barrel fold metal-dependent hydrolase
MARNQDARVQLLNVNPRSPQLERFAKIPGLFFDTSRVEGTDGVPKLVSKLAAGRVLFGSHAPFLIPEAALIRVHESGQLDQQALRELLAGNADRLHEETRS